MEYSINQLARLSGVSTRTLRYYDEIGLLLPLRRSDSGYRIYGPKQVDQLQQILFFRALGVGLEDTQQLLCTDKAAQERMLCHHLADLELQQVQLTQLIANVQKTIRSLKGEIIMTDEEKFEGLKQKMLNENEAAYGAEIREKYGEEAASAFSQQFCSLTQAQYVAAQALSPQLSEALRAAMEEGTPAGATAQRCCDLHRQWLCYYWPAGTYSKQAHLGLGQMYCCDERFRAYYDKISPGAADFLLKALEIYCA